ncbi:hypothetical protein IB238_04240 [Rhizobium sp. ARZ01]|uniref:hypothetical protein n=1 Tax=Rhizobium sp. ARZ01 TaxID=2769313 RepID=UPI001783C248|nr:hypothetical protein [Rhizobium sp. ARZ01]MBD9371849.1 hypothetical protein [Rhizobium sp. ARZ01]
MTDGQYTGVTERQRGLLGAVLLMLALVVGQFITIERKISVRSGADPTVARTAAERSGNRASIPRPLSAGGGASSGDNWLLSNAGVDRRAAKIKSTGSGADPSADTAFFVPDLTRFTPLPETRMVVSFKSVVPVGVPRHDFEGRAPPVSLL